MNAHANYIHIFFILVLKVDICRSSANFPLDPGAGRDCEEGEDHVGAAPAAADAGPAQPQQGEARQGDHNQRRLFPITHHSGSSQETVS